MKVKTSIGILLISILVSIVFIIGIYIFNFQSHKISENPENWAQFGDYFGGIINPILGILNLIVLTYLTVKIVKEEDDRNKWTLQELARPYGYLNFDSDFTHFEINLNNCGLGPMLITSFSIEKKDGQKYSNFYDVLKDYILKTNVNPKIYTYHTGETSGAVSKDKNIFLLKVIHNADEDSVEDFKEFLKNCKVYLNEFKIKIEYEDMYNRKMPSLEEQIDFPTL